MNGKGFGGKELKNNKATHGARRVGRGTGDSRELPHLSLSASSMGRNDALL